jgi:Protein of unknown function (DUF1656)
MLAFPELVIGDVLVAPFVIFAAGALAILIMLRPFLRLVPLNRIFGSPPVAELSLYVLILTALIVLF